MKIVPASDSSPLVVLGDAMSLDNHERVMSLFLALQRLDDPRIRNVHPAYASILIDFDPLRLSHEDTASLVEHLNSRTSSSLPEAARLRSVRITGTAKFLQRRAHS